MDHDLDETGSENTSILKMPNEGLVSLMGKPSSTIIEELGKPSRIDPSLYGYEWWVYPINYKKYIQAGIKNDIIVTIFATGTDVGIPPFKIGQPVAEIYSLTVLDTNISLEYNNSSYKFELSEDDLNTRPLIMIGNVYAQLYLDKFSGTLSSIRLIDSETLIKLHPYEMVYRGEMLEGYEETTVKEEAVERGKERQIFDITNVFRVRNKLDPLEWDEQTAEVALAHSKDMYESQQFSHISEEFGDLADRLEAGNVFYQIAGENIAANYLDAPAAVEGWLNSKGHRESLLNEQFTHLGVGVYNKHYTQNFIEKWQE
ncbi:CAP domain-containing protein [Bacillus sp. DTU_2020_1000418_1_SI_GHA_SEK_038]|uniref:CAP domain-containing protein n=1 Tax=Bacillus sp. DTU_2020_1000418_1_SI_GHA_SEK_038 TaxID=3077585 RepID=UPI0028E685C7|nr:CAP domain-containing protein [Bacillus sp. DTU_2020_1000418_1_SI_GHA_SEK_038]WNS77050.1 CAP domain-containing protein [Bacillus sp. DTU_2020_1000418_1_SI_GHA_SEK_038]